MIRINPSEAEAPSGSLAGARSRATVPERPASDRFEFLTGPLSKPAVVGLFLILVVAAFLRFWQIAREGLWYDELIMANITSGPWSGVWRETVDARPPAYVMLSWLWTRMFGASDAGLRSLSATLGVASVAMMFVAGRQLFGTRIALIATVLLALSPYQIRYSQEHRYYALVVFVGLVCLWMLIRGLRSGRSGWFIGFGLSGSILLFAHYLSVLVFLAMAAGVVISWRRWPSPLPWAFWVSIPLALAIASVPMINQAAGMFYRAGAVEQAAVEMVSWVRSPEFWSPIRTLANFLFLGARFFTPIAAIVGLGVAVAGCAWTLRRSDRHPLTAIAGRWRELAQERRPELLLLVTMVMLPMATSLVVSWVIEPMYVDRYMIAMSPAVYLLLAVAIVSIQPLLAPSVATLSIAVLMVASTYSYFTESYRGDWRGAAAFLNGQISAQDTLIYSSERGDFYETLMVGVAIRWYLTLHPVGYELSVAQPPADIRADVARKAARRGRTWLVVWDDPDRDRQVERHLKGSPDAAFTLIGRHDFYQLTIFEIQLNNADQSLTRQTR